MAKKIKLTKAQQRKLSRSWIGIVIILAIIGYNFYQENKPIPKGERFTVKFEKGVDGDTAWFNVEGQSTKVRMLYIDTPESTKEVEPYGKEASEYTEKQLSGASKIELELNVDGDSKDKYDRLLAWVFVDGELLQEMIARQGYVKKFYDYGFDYTYKQDIIVADKEAKEEQRGIYQK